MFYNPALQWAEWTETNVLQPHSVAALQWAEPNTTLSQLRSELWA